MGPYWAVRILAPGSLVAGVFLLLTTAAAGRDVADIFADLASAVVRVKVITEEPDENGKPTPTVIVSSGFFIDDAGRLLTSVGNPRVISHAVRKLVEWKGVQFPAELVGFDPQTSVALLQVLQLPDQFATIPVKPPASPLRVGAPLLSLTTPFAITASGSGVELPPTPVRGMVTGYEASIANFDFPFTYLRSDLPLRAGETGAAVLDEEGKLAGIFVSWVSDVRSCYVVPAVALERMVDDLKNLGKVTYRTLPLKFAERENAKHTAIEVAITEVAPGGSAARAGLQTNDVVRRIGTLPITRIRDVRDALFFSRVGDYTRIEVERDGRRQEWVLPVEEKLDSNNGEANREEVKRANDPTTEETSTPPITPPPPPGYLESLERALAPGNN